MLCCLDSFPNWDTIRKDLVKLSEKKLKPQKIIETLQTFKWYSHLSRQKNAEKELVGFPVLFFQSKDQLQDIFAKVANFLLLRPKMEIPLLRSGEKKECTLTKQHILYMFCTMILCLIPQQEFDKSIKERSRWNNVMDFSYIFQEEGYKTITVIDYIRREIDNVKSYGDISVIRRNVEKKTLDQILEQNKDGKMSRLSIEGDEASIEDYYGCLKADFANKFLGGGALLSGCVQQQIMFANHPQLFTAQMLCEMMEPNQSIVLLGFKKHSKNRGYGFQVCYDGPETHTYEYSPQKLAKEYITAIDAINYRGKDTKSQFSKQSIDRQLLKAYVGFSFEGYGVEQVVTGNWGCGAFRGDLKLKLVIQWLACSLAGKQMVYCPFGSKTILEDKALLDKMSKHSIGENYRHLLRAAQLSAQTPDKNIYQKL